MKRRAFAAAVCVLLSVTSASAETPLDAEADAERLFHEAQALMAARRFGEACPKLEAVYAMDQELGTLLNLAYCHKMQGARWQAWLEFKEADVKAAALKRTDRRDFARKRMAELERTLARAVVDVPPGIELTDVLVEDRRVPEAELGGVFAAEPGPRKVTFRARGKRPAVQLVTFALRARPQHIAVPPLEPEPELPAPVVAAPAPAEPPAHEAVRAPVAPVADAPSSGGAQRTVAIVLTGVGAVAIASGLVTGAMTFSNPCATSSWGGESCPAEPGARRDEMDRGKTTGAIADVSFAVGGAALAGALVLWLTAPSAKSASTGGGSAGPSTAARSIAPEIGLGWASVRGAF